MKSVAALLVGLFTLLFFKRRDKARVPINKEILSVMIQREATQQEWSFEDIANFFDGKKQMGEIHLDLTELERAGLVTSRQVREPKVEGAMIGHIYPVYRLTDAGRNWSTPSFFS